MSEQHGLFSSMVFDWYQATIPATEAQILGRLGHLPGQTVEPCRKVIGQYDRAVVVKSGHKELFKLHFGGNNDAKPNLLSQGFYARFVAPEVRKLFPEHNVTRMDVACDFSKEGLFDVFHAFMDKIHLESGVKRDSMGFGSPENGRTFYLGSNKSPMRVRLYEKGKKEASQGDLYADENWIRLEAQYRPRSGEKTKFSKVDAEGVWGATRWSRILISAILDIDPKPIRQEPPVERTAEDKALYALNQYKRIFQEVGEERIHQMLKQEVFKHQEFKRDYSPFDEKIMH